MKTILLEKSSINYPSLLREISDPPATLYALGECSLLNDPCIAIVGTRRSSDYGEYLTHKLVEELAAYKVNIVSGLAMGIDTLAHKAALKNRLKTIAVIGSGIKNIYPRSNLKLADEISKNGLILSEYPDFTPPLKHHFPNRNRIISGISLATLVIEAPERSGALITAYLAFDQNREVFTVPGDIDRENSLGPLKLIQKNVAHPISSAKELIEILNLSGKLFSEQKKELNTSIQLDLSQEQERLFNAISANRFVSFEKIHEICPLPIQQLLVNLSSLEINDLIETKDGKYRRKC
ncbi:DNA-protecting protein DprA [Candidatus Peregrinibacteria bacterium]|nr:DNA-protecting protein DprA [Candidatus Peregrinibacteria bacterium]